ncbi:shikimate dehydrogenase [Rufibacter glacialis]|uniref:Shikimate dehydrogenase n=1 Tax=Rufibacter glacialis TaxID=1259555 RepID=A0A5M8QRF4_9BACT|nr:shikimate dehydrogenase [Rufibacter glacialis]KAA6437236.1 shikimate dehydrogenase [Rufibacter glacialis]GGK60879.1 shikimate 5-dehydrogenase [Rufibacter glacialis]
MEHEYGLVGYKLTHSFSQKYFTEKFSAEGIKDSVYHLFELDQIADFPELLRAHPNLKGLNVTIPYKETIIPFLDGMEAAAARIGAVNVVKFENGQLIGHNSDYQGFMQSLQNFYPCYSHSQALVLGTGGAAKAVMAALEYLNIAYKVVSRQPRPGMLTYQDLTPSVLSSVSLIVNASPMGTFPNHDQAPDLPYELLSAHHYLYDLVYNPAETLFMKRGKEMGAKTINGYEMLCLQAEVAWQIWHS